LDALTLGGQVLAVLVALGIGLAEAIEERRLLHNLIEIGYHRKDPAFDALFDRDDLIQLPHRYLLFERAEPMGGLGLFF